MARSISEPPPWANIIMHKRLNTLASSTFENTSTEWSYSHTTEEAKLHEYRNKIDSYEKTICAGDNKWEYYKKVINPYELVYTQKKYTDFPESVCILHPLSRSYFKMIEMLDLINYEDMFKNETIRTAHVCEGPGGFVEAIFEKSEKFNKRIASSLAMTLRSKQTNIPGWKRATKFLQKHRNISITYGADDSGDILKYNNQNAYIEKIGATKVNIFTGDGGFDFSVDYTKQEHMIFPLLIATTRIGFEILKKGGVFIIKIFDFYNKATADLLYFLSEHFSEWTLYKPATSRPCNPEQYFIGKGFIGTSEKSINIIRTWSQMICEKLELGQLFISQYPDKFITILHDMRTKSFKNQCVYFERVFSVIEEENNTDIIKKYLKKHEVSSYDWCRRFKVPVYTNRCHLIEVLRNDLRASDQL